MVRGTHTRKRSRSSANTRPMKRRRTARRRTGRRTNNFTSQSGMGGGLQFRSKRLSRRRWNNMLWNNTLQKQHYRSNIAFSTSINTPATATTMTILGLEALRFAGNTFYTAAGGAIAPDTAQSLPVFTGDIVIRGGIMGIQITNTLNTALADGSVIRGTIYLVKTALDYTPTAITNPVNYGWDPTLTPDFRTKIGRVLYKKNFLLKDTESASIEYRLRIEKMDVGDYTNNKNAYVWFILAGNVDSIVAHNLFIQEYYNMSFVADAV